MQRYFASLLYCTFLSARCMALVDLMEKVGRRPKDRHTMKEVAEYMNSSNKT